MYLLNLYLQFTGIHIVVLAIKVILTTMLLVTVLGAVHVVFQSTTQKILSTESCFVVLFTFIIVFEIVTSVSFQYSINSFSFKKYSR